MRSVAACLTLAMVACFPDPPHDPGDRDGGSGGCLAGETLCGPVCVDLQTNPSHCGACNQPCYYVESCRAGACGCGCSVDEDCAAGCQCVGAMTDCDGDGSSESADCVCPL